MKGRGYEKGKITSNTKGGRGEKKKREIEPRGRGQSERGKASGKAG